MSESSELPVRRNHERRPDYASPDAGPKVTTTLRARRSPLVSAGHQVRTAPALIDDPGAGGDAQAAQEAVVVHLRRRPVAGEDAGHVGAMAEGIAERRVARGTIAIQEHVLFGVLDHVLVIDDAGIDHRCMRRQLDRVSD